MGVGSWELGVGRGGGVGAHVVSRGSEVEGKRANYTGLVSCLVLVAQYVLLKVTRKADVQILGKVCEASQGSHDHGTCGT